MSATFVCPHCGAVYPRKPTLVGRPVRCTACKQAFRLREDGIADKVESPAPAPPVPAPPASVAPPPPSSPAKPPPKPPEDRRKTTSRLTAQQVEARREMASTLTSAMSDALKADSVKREAEAAQNAKNPAEKAEGRVGKIGPAILTGEGEQAARARRMWALVIVLLVVLVGGCRWLLMSNSPQHQAIIDFSSVVESPRALSYVDRVQAMQARAWFVNLPPANVGVPAMVNMDDVHLQSARVVRLDKVKFVFTEVLKGLVTLDQPPIWAEPKAVEAIRAAWKPETKVAAFVASLAQRNILVVDQAEIETKMKTAGLSADDAKLAYILLRGKTKHSGENEIAKRLLAGDLPEHIEVASFWGNHGRLLGTDSRTTQVPYRGQILRFVGQGWPTGWKILTLEHGERK